MRELGSSWRFDIFSPGTIKLAYIFDGFYISHVSRLQNIKADALAAPAATLALPVNTSYRLTVATNQLFCPKYSLEVNEVHTIFSKLQT